MVMLAFLMDPRPVNYSALLGVWLVVPTLLCVPHKCIADAACYIQVFILVHGCSSSMIVFDLQLVTSA